MITRNKRKSSRKRRPPRKGKAFSPRVAIIMGSKNDFRIMREAGLALKDFSISFEEKIVSAHRTPEYMFKYASEAEQRGVEIIIAGAGGAAHLPGMVASLTPLPVIGVPIKVGHLEGLDALLSVAQMPKGVPVACVSVDGAYNAGLLAARILSSNDTAIRVALNKFRKNKRNKSLSQKIK